MIVGNGPRYAKREGHGRLYRAAVYDILDEMGLPAQSLDLAIRPLDRRTRIAGLAMTILGGPDSRGDEEYAEDLKIGLVVGGGEKY